MSTGVNERPTWTVEAGWAGCVALVEQWPGGSPMVNDLTIDEARVLGQALLNMAATQAAEPWSDAKVQAKRRGFRTTA